MIEKIYPLLRSHAWVEARGLGEIGEDIFNIQSDLYAAPVIIYARDQGNCYEYFSRSTTDTALKENGLENLNTALKNHPWESIDLAIGQNRIRYLALIDHEFAAEGLLLPGKLADAQEQLNSKGVYVCTPTRGMLLAYPLSDDAHHFDVFQKVCEENYLNAADEALSPIVWIVEAGVITGYLDPSEKGNLSVTRLEHSPKNHTSKVYVVPQIILMTLFGTVLSGIYALWHNFRMIGERKKSDCLLVAGLFIVPLYVYCFVHLPRTPYDRLFPLAIASVIGLFGWLTQARRIEQALLSGAKRQTIRAQLGVVLISLFLLIPLIVWLMP